MKLLKQLSLSTYIRYFLSYLIIFVLFAIGFFCIIRNQLTENYYNQKSEQIKSQLDSFAKQIDNDITFLYQIDSSIKSNAELIMNRYKSPHVFRHKIFKELTQYETSNKLIDSIIYMSKGMHEVISTDILVEYKNEMFYLINSTGQSIAFDPDDYYNTSSGQIFFLTNERLQYDDPELAKKAAAMKTVICQLAWNGEFFEDNAVRDEKGNLVKTGHTTETCQYYAFYFDTASRTDYPELFEKLLTKFGPKRDVSSVYPEVYQSNAIVGNYLRLELLLRFGYTDQVLAECCDFFLDMADMTGTLWEHASLKNSLNHGFASVAAVYIDECINKTRH